MKLSIIANPISGGGRAYRRIESILKAWPHQGWEAELLPTRCAGHAGVLARELLEKPPDRLAVCGGDGTFNDVVSNLPDPPFPIALIPAGTANVLAHEVGLPFDPARAIEIAVKGPEKRVDLGLLQAREERRFLLMAGIGFDAYVVSKVPPKKRKFGLATFYVTALRALLAYSFPEFHVLADGETIPATSCLVANCRRYGGGLVFTPDARMDDGLLDLYILQEQSKTGNLRRLYWAWRGRPGPPGRLQRRRISRLRVEGPRGVWVQVDGELVGTLPVDVTLSRASFPLVVP